MIEKDIEMDKMRRTVEKALGMAEDMCGACKDCIDKECKGWWVKFNLKKALSNIPKQEGERI